MAKLVFSEVEKSMEFLLVKTDFVCYKTGIKKEKNYRFGDSFVKNEIFVVTKKPYRDKTGSRMIDFLAKSECKEYTVDWLNFKNNTSYKI